jgi:DNA-directed RNA polymerase subunit alpha
MADRIRWRGLELPVQVRANRETLTNRYGEFLAEPFERGYGHTIGNSLRRVLLSSLEGAAVVAVKIEGVQQEFSAIPGVQEDVAEILLNLKELVLRLHPDEEHTVKIDVTKKGDLTAGDIIPDPDVDVVNPAHKIATLTEETRFACELIVRKGRGYVPVDEHEDLPRTIGLILLDAAFSPVQRVSYSVSDTRVGRRTNYDCLTLQIWTDGSVSPEMALVEASKIVRKHINPFVEYFELGRMLPQEQPEPLAPVKSDQPPQVAESMLSMPVKCLDLSIRALNCLSTEGVKTVGQLLEKREEEILAIRNFGTVTLDEVRERLAGHGLELALLAPDD